VARWYRDIRHHPHTPARPPSLLAFHPGFSTPNSAQIPSLPRRRRSNTSHPLSPAPPLPPSPCHNPGASFLLVTDPCAPSTPPSDSQRWTSGHNTPDCFGQPLPGALLTFSNPAFTTAFPHLNPLYGYSLVEGRCECTWTRPSGAPSWWFRTTMGSLPEDSNCARWAEYLTNKAQSQKVWRRAKKKQMWTRTPDATGTSTTPTPKTIWLLCMTAFRLRSHGETAASLVMHTGPLLFNFPNLPSQSLYNLFDPRDRSSCHDDVVHVCQQRPPSVLGATSAVQATV
jgi:hypothetical protein